MQLLDLRGQLIAVAAGGTVDDFLVPAASFASDSEAAGLEGAFATSGAVSTTRVLGQAAKEGIAIYSVTAENFDEVRPSLVVDSGTLRQITDAVEMGATVTLPQRAPTIEGWAGSAYIVQHDGSLAYRISGGMNGGWVKLVRHAVGAYAVYQLVTFSHELISNGYENVAACFAHDFLALIQSAVEAAGLALLASGLGVGVIMFLFIHVVVLWVALWWLSQRTEEECIA